MLEFLSVFVNVVNRLKVDLCFDLTVIDNPDEPFFARINPANRHPRRIV